MRAWAACAATPQLMGLIEACKAGSYDAVAAAITSGEDVNQTDQVLPFLLRVDDAAVQC